MATGKHDPVYRISGAQVPLSEDVDARTRRYLISMAIRTLCFIGGVIVFTVFNLHALGLILFVGAVFLPYVAVVVANSGRERVVAPPEGYVTGPADQLNAGPDTDESPTDDSA